MEAGNGMAASNSVGHSETKQDTKQMSHNYNKENPPVVSRNGKSLPLALTTFGKTSDFKGQSFWTLEVTAANQDDARAFIGDDIVNPVLTRFMRKVAIDLFTDPDNKDEHGQYIWDNIISGFQSLDTGGATLKELSEERDEIIDLSNALMDSADFEVNEDGTKVNPEKWEEINSQLLENNKKLSRLKRSIKAIQDKYALIAAKRQANKAPATA